MIRIRNSKRYFGFIGLLCFLWFSAAGVLAEPSGFRPLPLPLTAPEPITSGADPVTQAAVSADYVNLDCFAAARPVNVPALTLLSPLV